MRTQFLLFACFEGGLDFDLEVEPAGHFQRRPGQTGPHLVVDRVPHVELNVALRRIGRDAPALAGRTPQDQREIETWLEQQATWLRPAGVAVYRALQRGQSDDHALRTFQLQLLRMNAALSEREYLAREFSLADCTAPFLFTAVGLGQNQAEIPTLLGYLDRVRRRPAWALAHQRWLDAQPKERT